MKILMVVAYFPPEIGSAAHVYYDLAKMFKKKGHHVHVLTSYPRDFNLKRSDQGEKFPDDEIMDGFSVSRCKHFAIRDLPLLRGFEHFFLPYIYFNKYKEMNEEFDICLMYIPPLPLYKLAQKIKKYDGTPSVLNYQDFHPQELIDVNYGGIKNNFIIIKILEHMERESYKKADYITVLSDGGIDYVINKGADPSKVKRIFNGINREDIEKYKLKKDFKQKEGIEDKFLVTYAGILSPFQGIDNILNGAIKLKNDDDIVFYIIGDGMITGELEERVLQENIKNIKILPFQEREEYFNIINSSDISIVSLDERMKAPCLPGKITNLMAMGQTMIGIVPKESEAANIINSANCGVIVKPGDDESFKTALLSLKGNIDLINELGCNGRVFFENNMDLDNNTAVYEKIFKIITTETSR